VVKDIANVASDAASHALKAEEPPLKAGERAVAYVPLAADGLVSGPMMLPPIAVAPVRKRKRAATKRPAKARSRKTAKKTARTSANKPTKKSLADKSGKAAKKTRKTTTKKTANKPRKAKRARS
jgi:hypothetical protein